MNWYGSGFITIINYASGASMANESFAILTENSLDILTESSAELLTEASP